MRKILAITICTLCLCVPVTAKADDNVTNQLEEILVQLDNLDQVIQFFIDNQENLQTLVEADLWNDHLRGVLPVISTRLNLIRVAVDKGVNDVAIIKADVAALSADLAGYVSQIVNSINGLTSEFVAFQYDLAQQLYCIQFLLTKPQLDESLHESFGYFLSQLDNNSSMLATYRTTLTEILQSIQSMDYSDQVEAALYNISIALDNLGQINVVIDLQEELENMDLFVNVDLGAALEGLENNLSSVLSTVDHISYLFEVFINLFSEFKSDQGLTNQKLRDFAYWYQYTFFPGLQQHIIMQNQWLLRQEAREQAEDEHREKEEDFMNSDLDDISSPTDADASSQLELENVEMDEPEAPDGKIDAAQERVSTDMKEVEDTILDELDVVDASFENFVEDVKFKWGDFNPVFSVSFTPPLGDDYTMSFSYDFSKSEFLSPIRTATSGIWTIFLFVQSYLAISATFHSVLEN